MLGRIGGLVDEWIARRVDPDDRLKQIQTPTNEFGYDSFGFNREFVRRALLPAKWIYRHYFRVQCFGTEKVPSAGRVFLIANHSGQLPLDAAMILLSMLVDKQPPRMVRTMVERWVAQIPFFSYLFARWGQIVGIPDNCREVLENEEAILVFPEGVRGISKTFDRAYELQEFGLGFMRLALEMGVPIVPVAVVGAEEQAPALANLTSVGGLIGAPAFPVTPTFPLLGPLGVVPLPTKWSLDFGDPVPMDAHGPDAAEDPILVNRLAEQVRGTVQRMIDGRLARRRSIWFG